MRRLVLLAGTCALLLVPAADLLSAQPQPALPAQPDPAVDLWQFEDEEEEVETWGTLLRDQAGDLLLFVAFATLALISFFRKSVRLKYVTLVAAVAYLGFSKSQLISVVNIYAVLTGNLPVFKYSLGWYLFAGFTVVSTVLWGRLYCGRVCAYGALTQLLDRVVPARLRVEVPKWLERRASLVKFGLLGATLLYFLLTADIGAYRYVEPFWMFTRQASTGMWIGLAVLLAASLLSTKCTPIQLEFPRVGRRRLVARFGGGRITSNAGALLLQAVEACTQVCRRAARCFQDHRDGRWVEHTVEELVTQRVLGLALGYEDLNDHDTLRRDALLAAVVGKADPTGASRVRAADRGSALAGKSTLNRLELAGPGAETDRYKKVSYDAAALRFRAQPLLPLPLPRGGRAGAAVEADRIRDQTLVRVQHLQDLREDLRMGRDSRAADRNDRVRAVRRLRAALRGHRQVPALDHHC